VRSLTPFLLVLIASPIAPGKPKLLALSQLQGRQELSMDSHAGG